MFVFAFEGNGFVHRRTPAIGNARSPVLLDPRVLPPRHALSRTRLVPVEHDGERGLVRAAVEWHGGAGQGRAATDSQQ